MSEPIRVPMPSKAAFVGVGDVAVSAQPYDPMRVGRRFNFDISEEALSKIGQYALEHAIADVAHSVVSRYRHEIEQRVFSYIHEKMTREWVEPILRDVTVDVFLRWLADINAQYYAMHPEDADHHPIEQQAVEIPGPHGEPRT